MEYIISLIQKGRLKYVHKEFKLGWFRISWYHFQDKFTLRFEISRGW